MFLITYITQLRLKFALGYFIFLRRLKMFSQFFSSLGASETYTCPRCGRTYDKRPSFAKHYKFCGVDFECEYCGKKYSRTDSVKKHQRLAHSVNT